MSTAIKFENISKQYRLGVVSTQTLSHDLNRWWKMNIRGKEDPYLKIGEVNDRAHKGESEYVWALKDINFEVQQGDVLGIIGKNGAGKSTLLKILSKVTAPTTGTIKAAGRIASLLEVGTGFHPEMTGRENIYMNGAIMGMTKAEITRRFDEIVDFSGVERYIDTPAKRYSSGMTVRLGFAIAAHLEPEILVVDEVLAVGDAEFQKKAIGKMQDVSRGEGRTVLFVSHNMASMKTLCNRGLLFENGSVKYSGEIGDVVSKYFESDTQNDIYYPRGNVVKEVKVSQNQNKIELLLKYESDVIIRQPNLGFVIYDNNDNPIFGTNPLKNGIYDFGKPKKNGEVRVEISSPILVDGIYPLSVWFNDGVAYSEHIFQKEKCVFLTVVNMNNLFIQKEKNLGLIIPLLTFNFE
jgi:lipopolysaccharide transport system ATP-binding protein